jgi:hypothetical protein
MSVGRRLECELCERVVWSSQAMADHMRDAHQIIPPSELTSQAPISATKVADFRLGKATKGV